MMLFEGTSLATLRLVAETKSGRELVGGVEGGHTYCFAVAGPASANSFFAFNLSLAFPAHPVNDAPESRSRLTGEHIEANGTTIDATPDPGSVFPRVWWEWTAPHSGLAFIRMLNPSLQATFEVWPLESSGFLTDAPMNRARLWDDRTGEAEPLARYVWTVRQGETYLIATVQELFTEPQNFAFQLVVSDFGLQADRTLAVPGETVSLTVAPPGFLTGIREVLLHSSDGLTQTNSGARFTFPWIPAEPGDFRFQAVVVDDLGRRWPATNSVSVRILDRQAVPSNDLFVNRTRLPSQTNLVLALDEAGIEPGEPASGSRSVWFEWTPESDGHLLVSFFRYLGVLPRVEAFEGTSMASLQPVAGFLSTNNLSLDWEFATTVGRPLLLRVSADQSLYATVPVSIAGGPVPPHDSFAQRRSLPSGSFQVTDDNRLATVEPGEPDGLARTLWYNWVAPADGVLRIPQSFGNSRIISMYSGSWWPPQVLSPRFGDSYPVGQGINYLLVASAADLFGDPRRFPEVGGPFTWEGLFSPSPSNDGFNQPIPLSAGSIRFSGDFAGAQPPSVQPFLHRSYRYLWYEWLATDAGIVRLSVNPEFDGELVVVAMDDPGRALNTERINDQWTFPARPGIRYRIGLGNPFGGVGSFQADLRLPEPAANDDFSQPTVLTGTRATLKDSSFGSTTGPGEPDAPSPGTGCTWWRWTSPRAGWVALRSAAPPPLRVFQGEALDTLVEVAVESEQAASQIPEQRFETRQDTTYYLAVYGDPSSPFEFLIELDFSTFRVQSPQNGAVLVEGDPVEIEVPAPNPESDGILVGPASILAHLWDEPDWAPWRTIGTIAQIPGTGFLDPLSLPGLSLRIAATNSLGEVRLSQPVSYRVRPSNDDFSRAKVVIGDHWTNLVVLRNATFESQEPATGAGESAGSVWFQWQAPATGQARPVLDGPPGSGVEWAAYTGNSLATLRRVQGWEDRGSLAIPITRGVNYLFRNQGPTSAANESFVVESLPYRISVPGPAISRKSDVVLQLISDLPPNQIASVRYLGDNFGPTPPATEPPYAAPLGPTSLLTNATSVQALIEFKDGTTWSFPNSIPLRWRPDNDDVADAQHLTNGFRDGVTTAGGTFERNEPASGARTNSLWWDYEVPETGFVRFTSDNSALLFEPFLVPALGSWAGGVRAAEPTANLMIPVEPGQKLLLRCSSAAPAAGIVDFRFSRVGPNHDFNQAITLPPEGGTFEAEFGPYSTYYFYWWITPSRSGDFLLESAGSGSPQIQWQLTSGGVGSELLGVPGRTPVEAGKLYCLTLVLLDDFGMTTLNASIVDPMDPPTPPNNDVFERRLVLPADGVERYFPLGATPSDPREPGLAPGVPIEGLRTLWFSWTSPVRQRVAWFSNGWEIGVFRGNSLESLWPGYVVTAYVEFFAEANETFVFMARAPGWVGTIWIGLYPQTPPPNDNFDHRIPLVGDSASLVIAGSGATREFGEPWHGGRPSPSTRWWSWTAPADGKLNLSLDSNENDPSHLWLGVYRGTELSQLEPAVSDPFNLNDRSVELPVTTGDVIQIVVASDANVTRREVSLRFQAESPLWINIEGEQLVLRWPKRPADMVLEASPGLILPDWKMVPGVNGTEVRLPLPTDSPWFFRLRPE
ncbi:MAG: hypothetical protein KIT22_08025 [Verrucomicrobiae bacterium]|nr:hypothetical protein [Verrucomicrobiae bacterium]